jgi:hypothetical protein
MNAAPDLLARIEAECENKLLCAGDLAENILEIIRASPRDGAAQACASCTDLRGRLVNIYHLTLTYGDDAPTALRTIRAASSPGAPAPAVRFERGCLHWPGGGMNLSMLRALLARAGLEIVMRGSDA